MWLGHTTEFWIGLSLGLAGLLASIIFGLRRRRGRLSIGVSSAVNLLSGIVKEIPKLEVKYEGNTLTRELVWLSGYISNTGGEDVGRTIVSQFLKNRLLSGAEWKEFKIGELPEGLSAEHRVLSATEVQISWDLLRPFEFIPFSAVISTDDRMLRRRLEEGKGLVVVSRIENTSVKLGGGEPSTPQEARRSVRRGLIFSVLLSVMTFAIATVFLINISSLNVPAERELEFEVVGAPGEIFTILADRMGNGMILSDIKNGRSRNLPFTKSPAIRVHGARVVSGDWVIKLISWITFSFYLVGLPCMTIMRVWRTQKEFRRWRSLAPTASLREVMFRSKVKRGV